MNTEAELTRKLWKHLDTGTTVMLGLSGVEEGHAKPMTAQFDGEAGEGPIWFFTAVDTELVRALADTQGHEHRAVVHFASKGHDLFASLHGDLALDNDRAVIDRLWNPFVAAWYEKGKDDPKLQLVRFRPERAQVWLNEHAFMTGIQLLLGKDPKKSYRDKVADVRLGGTS